MEWSLLGSSVHGILQARILEWCAMPSSRGSSWPRLKPESFKSPALDRWVLYHQRHLGSPEICVLLIKEFICTQFKTHKGRNQVISRVS